MCANLEYDSEKVLRQTDRQTDRQYPLLNQRTTESSDSKSIVSHAKACRNDRKTDFWPVALEFGDDRAMARSGSTNNRGGTGKQHCGVFLRQQR